MGAWGVASDGWGGGGGGCSKLDNTTVVRKTPGKSHIVLLISNKTSDPHQSQEDYNEYKRHRTSDTIGFSPRKTASTNSSKSALCYNIRANLGRSIRLSVSAD